MGDARAPAIKSTARGAAEGMGAFMTIWAGQLVSLIGSGLTSFALGVWIYDTTGRALPFAVTAVFGRLPAILLSPLAGAVVDRRNRRAIMILADTGAALATLFAAIMVITGQLQIWHIYLISLVASTCEAFQRPAYMASVTMLVPKKQLGRASGLTQTSEAISILVPPLIAGFLFVAIGLRGIILIDFITFFFAIGALLIVHIPQPETGAAAGKARGSLWKESTYGWGYLRERPGLLAMLFYFALGNFLLNTAGVLITPMVLSFADARILGLMQFVLGVGMLGGSIAMSIWGGPKRKMLGIYGFIAVTAVGYALIGLRASPWVIGLGLFITLASVPIASGCSQVIWQSKVAPDVQGRVFATRSMLSWSMIPLANITAGLLADQVFEPMMTGNGALAAALGRVIGTGPGRGMGLMFVLSGLLLLVVTAIAYSYPRMRLVEDELPDAIPEAAPEGAA
jgi:DHA3 family macrolide efflux protein-like MFS transporter